MSSAVRVIANQLRLSTTGGSFLANVTMLTGHKIKLATSSAQAPYNRILGFISLPRLTISTGETMKQE